MASIEELAEAVKGLLSALEDPGWCGEEDCFAVSTHEAGDHIYCEKHARLANDEEPLMELPLGTKIRRIRALLAQIEEGK